ncbi:MAG: fibronectin type III domain-containing protein, partial [Eubacteriales bacterium]
MFYPKTLIGTAFDWYHFEYTVDYDNNKYSVKIADKVMPYLESDKIIPQGFIDNGGGTYFQTVLVTSNLGADVPNLEMYIKNFTVTTGETMWPEENALTVTDVLSSAATLNWNPLDTNGVTGYEIYKNDELIDTIMNPNQTSYTVSNLTGSTTYDFSVKPLFADTETYDKTLNISVTTGGVILRENMFQQLSAGRTHIIGANKNAAVKAWGGNSMGQTNSGMTKP